MDWLVLFGEALGFRKRSRVYRVNPGNIRSKHDGQTHWICASRLAKLYHLSLRDPNVIMGSPNIIGIVSDEFVDLYPLSSGNYDAKARRLGII